MRKISIALALLVAMLMTNTLSAQVSIAVGPKLGLNFSSISYDPDITLPSGVTKGGQTNIMFGGAVEVAFAKMFAVQFEPMYTQSGDKFEQGSAKQTNTGSVLEIPILFKAKFIEGPVKPFAFAGPNIGFVLSSKTKIEGVGAGVDREVDTKDSTSSTNFAIDFGGGAEYKVARNISLTGDIRYSLGLSNLNKASGGVPSVKTRGFQVLFGVLFNI